MLLVTEADALCPKAQHRSLGGLRQLAGRHPSTEPAAEPSRMLFGASGIWVPVQLLTHRLSAFSSRRKVEASQCSDCFIITP